MTPNGPILPAWTGCARWVDAPSGGQRFGPPLACAANAAPPRGCPGPTPGLPGAFASLPQPLAGQGGGNDGPRLPKGRAHGRRGSRQTMRQVPRESPSSRLAGVPSTFRSNLAAVQRRRWPAWVMISGSDIFTCRGIGQTLMALPEFTVEKRASSRSHYRCSRHPAGLPRPVPAPPQSRATGTPGSASLVSKGPPSVPGHLGGFPSPAFALLRRCPVSCPAPTDPIPGRFRTAGRRQPACSDAQ